MRIKQIVAKCAVVRRPYQNINIIFFDKATIKNNFISFAVAGHLTTGHFTTLLASWSRGGLLV
ncbi:MAG: hypothetical protein ABIC82_00545 [bacterium]